MSWIVWALLSAFFAGVTAVLAKAGVANLDPNLAIAVRTSVVLVLVWSIAFATAKPSAVLEIPRQAWLPLVLSGLATGASWLCYFHALKLGEVSRVAALDKLGVVFAILLAVVFLKERLGWQQAAGALLIVIGALVLAWPRH